MLEAAENENRHRRIKRQNFARYLLGAHRRPDCNTNQHITEDRTAQHLRQSQGHLGNGCIQKNLRQIAAVQAWNMPVDK